MHHCSFFSSSIQKQFKTGVPSPIAGDAGTAQGDVAIDNNKIENKRRQPRACWNPVCKREATHENKCGEKTTRWSKKLRERAFRCCQNREINELLKNKKMELTGDAAGSIQPWQNHNQIRNTLAAALRAVPSRLKLPDWTSVSLCTVCTNCHSNNYEELLSFDPVSCWTDKSLESLFTAEMNKAAETFNHWNSSDFYPPKWSVNVIYFHNLPSQNV